MPLIPVEYMSRCLHCYHLHALEVSLRGQQGQRPRGRQAPKPKPRLGQTDQRVQLEIIKPIKKVQSRPDHPHVKLSEVGGVGGCYKEKVCVNSRFFSQVILRSNLDDLYCAPPWSGRSVQEANHSLGWVGEGESGTGSVEGHQSVPNSRWVDVRRSNVSKDNPQLSSLRIVNAG